MITIKDLNKTYGFVHALKDVSLELDEGQVYGVVGTNGAGKTTLFRCIAGLHDYSGKISFSIANAKNTIGFLATEPYFLSYITGREYLQLMCKARKIKHTDFDETNIFELPLDRYATSYSTGMKKKLALMGILLQKNSIYILDEPFNGVDIQSNIMINEIIHKLKSLNKTILLSSHILSTLSDTCDKIILIKEGMIDREADKDAFKEIEADIRQSELILNLQRLKLE